MSATKITKIYNKKIFKYIYRSFVLVTAMVTALTIFPLTQANTAYSAEQPIFPIIGSAYFSNDFYARRSNGQHNATDIFAAKMSPIVAPVNGTVYYVNSPQASWGYSVGVRDSAGYEYSFIHMNNDTPGTDDGAGSEMQAYAPDMKVGNQVEKGQLLGYVGDSGNAENTPPHLHFEIYDPNNNAVNPYDHLLRWAYTPTPSLYPPLTGETLPYWVAYNGELNLATGDFNGDQQSETVTGAGYGGGPEVRTWSTDNVLLGGFFAYDPEFRGGIDVATGDLNGDGIDEIITGPGPGGGPWVRVFNANAQLLSQFAAYDPGFLGGIKVAAGDTNGDGIDEIITGPGSGGGPWVRVFNANAQLLSQFAAYDPGFLGGIDVTAGDTAGSTVDEIITGAGPGGGPWVRVFNTSAQSVLDFPVYDQNFKGGIRVSAGNVKPNYPKDEIMTIPLQYGPSHVRLVANTCLLYTSPSPRDS